LLELALVFPIWHCSTLFFLSFPSSFSFPSVGSPLSPTTSVGFQPVIVLKVVLAPSLYTSIRSPCRLPPRAPAPPLWKTRAMITCL
jgi:hypothetical protein